MRASLPLLLCMSACFGASDATGALPAGDGNMLGERERECLVESGVTQLDAHLRLPARPERFGELFANVQLRASAAPMGFDLDWGEAALREVELLRDRRDVLIPVEPPADIRQAQHLYVRLRFCTTRDCLRVCAEDVCDVDDYDPVAEIQVHIERPFYARRCTAWYFEFEDIPSCVDDACTTALDPSERENVGNVRDGLRYCAAIPGVPPTWRCEVPRCEVDCLRSTGFPTGGSCTGTDAAGNPDGRLGPHECESD